MWCLWYVFETSFDSKVWLILIKLYFKENIQTVKLNECYIQNKYHFYIKISIVYFMLIIKETCKYWAIDKIWLINDANLFHTGKEFLYKHNLISHASIHSGERPYQCSACPKNFRRKDDLQV